MTKTYSTTNEHSIVVSEAAALTILCALQSEQRRRDSMLLRPVVELERLIAEFDVIANARPCIVCDERTTRTFAVPQEGDVESGPYTTDVSCCSTACDERYMFDPDIEPPSDDEFDGWRAPESVLGGEL